MLGHDQDNESGIGNGQHSKGHVLGFSVVCIPYWIGSIQVSNVNCDRQLEHLSLLLSKTVWYSAKCTWQRARKPLVWFAALLPSCVISVMFINLSEPPGSPTVKLEN